ncbi:hypothetical protein [Shinella granuli]|uniref:thermonuclease family protein n=1 Tax=Shinella granuli TaxID=323621 RepID=UPI00315C7C9A
MLFRYLIMAGGLLVTSSVLAEDIVGRASVIDGGTIEISGERIRFNGIDAPESWQICQDEDGADYRCGKEAAMRELIATGCAADNPTSTLSARPWSSPSTKSSMRSQPRIRETYRTCGRQSRQAHRPITKP